MNTLALIIREYLEKTIKHASKEQDQTDTMETQDTRVKLFHPIRICCLSGKFN